MAYRKILHFPHSALREKSSPVVDFGDELESLVDDLADTLNVDLGVGLSAPQIGVTQRVIYIAAGDFRGAMINPVITDTHTAVVLNEGCLSFPGVFENVKRFVTVDCTYQDISGTEHKVTLDGISSHIIQHEIEHLDGKLLIDKLGTIKRDRIRRNVKKKARALKGLMDSDDPSRRKKKNSSLSKKEIKIRKKRRLRSKR